MAKIDDPMNIIANTFFVLSFGGTASLVFPPVLASDWSFFFRSK